MKRQTDKQYEMDEILSDNLNTLIYNMSEDWDFVMIITGSGMTRVGKSMLAQQIGYYCAYLLDTPFSENNIVFEGDDLVASAHELPKNSVIIYDEAREGLDSKRTMENVTKMLLDFFAECGMYNHLLILVLPDFFELNKGLALNRSEMLINLVRDSKEKVINIEGVNKKVLKYERGIFELFNRTGKKLFYINGKKNNSDYSYSKKYRTCFGEFRFFWVIDQEKYEKKKLMFLKRERQDKTDKFLCALKALKEDYNQTQISVKLERNGLKMSQGRISQLLRLDSKDKPNE